LARLPATPETEAPAGPPSPFRWLVLLGVWLVYASFGMVTISLAPLVEVITRDLGIGHASMGLVLGAWQLMFIVSAVPAGGLLDRYGVRRGLFFGALVIALSALLRSLSGEFWSLFIAVATLGLGAPMISTGAPKVVARYFRGEERGFAMGIYITGPAMGSMAALSLTNAVLMPAYGGDWRLVMRTWAVVALMAGIAWLLVAARAGVDAGAAGVAHAKGVETRQSAVIGQLLRVPSVQLLLAMSVGIFLFNHSLNNWLPEILRAKGMSPVMAGYWATVPTLVGLAGSLLIPRLATPHRRNLILGALFVSALAATLLLRTDQGPLLLAGLALQGIARSSMMTVAMLSLVETPGIGERHAATAGGLFFSAAEIGGASGPVLLGVIHDLTGGFSACLAFLTLVMCALITAAWRLQILTQRAATAMP
jgi:cyanate permease